MAYGTVEGLKKELTGLPLTRLAEGALLQEIIDDEWDTAQREVENICARRDNAFESNEGVAITLDGTGTEFMLLEQAGYVPLNGLSAVSIDGDAQTVGDFKYTLGGLIEFDRTGTFTGATSTTLVSTFTPGSQNIGLTIDWGYTSVPDQVERAVYLCGKARILQRIADAVDASDAAIPPGMQRFTSGEFNLHFDKDGQYGAQMRNCRKDVKRLLAGFILVVIEAPRGRRAYRGTGPSQEARAHYRTDA